ncbi:hypothetical protein HYW75_02770 [Candidatus Pacearchaeota archaeon]|nr:hypothetical protein [Candidatus Pacearchaeota archaeon]
MENNLHDKSIIPEKEELKIVVPRAVRIKQQDQRVSDASPLNDINYGTRYHYLTPYDESSGRNHALDG